MIVSSCEDVDIGLYPSELDHFVKVETETPRGFENVVWCGVDKESLVKKAISSNLGFSVFLINHNLVSCIYNIQVNIQFK